MAYTFDENTFSPSIVNENGVLAAVMCKAAAGKDYGYIELVCTVSDDLAKSWSRETVIAAPPAREISGDIQNTKSSFFLFPAMTVAPNGDLVLLATFFPESVGFADKKYLEDKKISFAYFDGKRCPLIYDRDGNFFYVLSDGTVMDKHKTPTEYAVKGLGELYKGEEYIGNIYLNGAKGRADDERKTTHGAPLKRSYIFMMKSSDKGKNWSDPKDITPYILNEKDGACLSTVSGSALTTDSGRLLFTLKTLKETVCIYSDDNGESWNRNQRLPYTGCKGEWMAFETPNKHLYGFGSAKGSVPSVMSADNGIIWMKGDKPKFKAPDCGKGFVTFDDKIFISHPNIKNGENGVISVGDYLFDKRGHFKGIAWRKENTLLSAAFDKSCLTAVDSTAIGILYESENRVIFEKIRIE